MRTYTNPRVIGNGPDAEFHQRNQRLLQEELQFYDSTTVTFHRSPRGITAHAKIPPGGQSISLQGFEIVSDGGDWYNCYMFDGVNYGAPPIQVAKHDGNRCLLPSGSPAGGAILTETKRGILYNYGYTAQMAATADGVNVIEYCRSVTVPSDTGLNTTSRITPCLNIGATIYALPCSFAGPASLVDVQWLCVLPHLEWADPE